MEKNVYRMVSCAVGIVVSAFVAVGCAIDTDGTEGASAGESRSERGGEAVAAVEQALTACFQVERHGGDAFERSFETLIGCDCGASFTRDFFKVWNNGHGTCSALGWASPDPRDCRVRVNVKNSAGFLWGECNVQVEKKDAASSCEGRCGGSAPSGCFCDAACDGFGDCCADVVRECRPSSSCLNRCGGSAPSGCFCDAACDGFGDCCSDKSILCPFGGG